MNLIYHYTYANNFISILNDNKLIAGQKEFGTSYISFTRNSKFNETSEFAGLFDGYFVIDKDKLKNNYNIKPYNYFYYSYKYDKNTYIKNIKDIYIVKSEYNNIKIDLEMDEQEERIKFKNNKTYINNFNKYIIKIILFKNVDPEKFNINIMNINDIKEYIKNKYDILVEII